MNRAEANQWLDAVAPLLTDWAIAENGESILVESLMQGGIHLGTKDDLIEWLTMEAMLTREHGKQIMVCLRNLKASKGGINEQTDE